MSERLPVQSAIRAFAPRYPRPTLRGLDAATVSPVDQDDQFPVRCGPRFHPWMTANWVQLDPRNLVIDHG